MADLEITQEITVELDGNSPFEYIVVKQGDKNSRIRSLPGVRLGSNILSRTETRF